ncbi:hypothetical protein [Terrisporobacter sp.]|uniref:ParM/StbA family protein n=1 Tax=Terrisporobacter sp. TaxID=1965305 RepID=UPI00399120CF
MSKKKVIAIDAGKFNLKGRSDLGVLVYNTKYTFENTDADMLGAKTYNIKYRGEEYTIGDNATYSDKNEGKDSLVHVICTLTSISLLRGDATDIILMYGESFNKYINPIHKRLLKSIFEGEHTITVGDEEHTFNINLCHILPEGMGNVLCNMDAYKGVRYQVDWGGTTVIFMKTINGRPDADVCRSFHLGMHNLAAIIEDKLIKAGQGRHEIAKIDEWIREGCEDIEKQKIINSVIKEQLLKIDDKLSAFGINLHEYLEVTFIGGTAQLFQSQIKAHYKCARIYHDCLMANVNGYYEYGIAKYGR